MTYEVDQSGKVEQTNLDTILVLTNDKSFSVVLKKRDKRIVQNWFKSKKIVRRFQYEIFSLLLAILLDVSKPKYLVNVDTEYQGFESVILERVNYYLKSLDFKNYHIKFGHVGKTSKSHLLASKIVSKKQKPTKIITLKELKKIGTQFGRWAI